MPRVLICASSLLLTMCAASERHCLQIPSGILPRTGRIVVLEAGAAVQEADAHIFGLFLDKKEKLDELLGKIVGMACRKISV